MPTTDPNQDRRRPRHALSRRTGGRRTCPAGGDRGAQPRDALAGIQEFYPVVVCNDLLDNDSINIYSMNGSVVMIIGAATQQVS